ncbi:MAG: glycosyltransferase [Dehalococcoidia bacterium]|nr:glycosyltransferase [Dehalococcoidia bacterium]
MAKRRYAKGPSGGVPPWKKDEKIDLRIAHWCNWAPHLSGMYETTRELITAENKIDGVLAGFCETPGMGASPQITKRAAEGGRVDGMHPEFRSQGWGWALKFADIHVLHSTLLSNFGQLKPKTFFISGTPESCLNNELEPGDKAESFSSAGRYIARTEATFVTSERARRFWSQFDYGGEKIHRVNKGIDLEWWKRTSTKQDLDGEPSVLYGEIWRGIKHPMHLFYAVDQIYRENPDIRLNVWGCNQRRGFWQNMINTLRFDDFLGKSGLRGIIDYPEHYYTRGDVLVSPGLYGDVSRVQQEAMACGCPTICWDTDQWKETHPYKYAKAFDMDDLARKIMETYEEVLGDREGIAKQCRDIAERYFDVNYEAQQIVAILRDVVSSQ